MIVSRAAAVPLRAEEQQREAAGPVPHQRAASGAGHGACRVQLVLQPLHMAGEAKRPCAAARSPNVLHLQHHSRPADRRSGARPQLTPAEEKRRKEVIKIYEDAKAEAAKEEERKVGTLCKASTDMNHYILRCLS